MLKNFFNHIRLANEADDTHLFMGLGTGNDPEQEHEAWTNQSDQYVPPCKHSLHLLRLEDNNAYHKPTADFEAITQDLFDVD